MLVAMYLAFSPVLAIHAATPPTNHQAPVQVIQPHNSHDEPPHQGTPYMRWRP
jgi:hypothetical protein